MGYFEKRGLNMQDFNKYNYIISISDIIKAQQAGQSITVIINGEYYDLKGAENDDRTT